MIVDSRGRASMQATLLPARPTGAGRLPGNWAEEFHSASSLSASDLATSEASDPRGNSGSELSRVQLAAVLATEASPSLDVVVLVRRVTDLATGTYAVGPGAALLPIDEVDPVVLCRDSLADIDPPAAMLAVLAAVPGECGPNGLRAYRHALVATGRFVLAVERAAGSVGVEVRGHEDFVDDAANRSLGLTGRDRACLMLVGIDGTDGLRQRPTG